MVESLALTNKESSISGVLCLIQIHLVLPIMIMNMKKDYSLQIFTLSIHSIHLFHLFHTSGYQLYQLYQILFIKCIKSSELSAMMLRYNPLR